MNGAIEGLQKNPQTKEQGKECLDRFPQLSQKHIFPDLKYHSGMSQKKQQKSIKT